MPIKLNGATSGSVELDVPATVSGGDVTLTLPPDDGSAGQVLSTNGAGALSFVNKVEWDQFQLTDNSTVNELLTDWSRCTYNAFGQFGGQMTVSNGIFTFPSTGYYLVIMRGMFNIRSSDTVVVQTFTTINNSSYSLTGYVSDGGNNGSTSRHGSSASFTFVDVTDTSNVKVKFESTSIASGSEVMGSSSSTQPYTNVTFVRLGDT